VGWWPTTAQCGFVGPPSSGQGYDGGSYIPASGTSLFTQASYFFNNLGNWFKAGFAPRGPPAGNIIKSDSQGLSLPTGPTATSAANLSGADKVGGFAVGVGIGVTEGAIHTGVDGGAGVMIGGVPYLAYKLAWVPGQVSSSMASGRGALGAATDVLEGANERFNPLAGMLNSGLG